MPWLSALQTDAPVKGVKRLVSPLEYKRWDGDVITVPTGFPSDGATTGIAGWLLSPWDRHYSAAAVVHDWLCVMSHQGLCKRSFADDTFDQAMRDMGTPAWEHWLLIHAVKLFTKFKGEK